MYDQRQEPNEFVADSVSDATSQAAEFFGVEASELKVVVPPDGEIFGAGGRSVIVAVPKEVAARGPRPSSGGDRDGDGGRGGRGRDRDRDGGGGDAIAATAMSAMSAAIGETGATEKPRGKFWSASRFRQSRTLRGPRRETSVRSVTSCLVSSSE